MRISFSLLITAAALISFAPTGGAAAVSAAPLPIAAQSGRLPLATPVLPPMAFSRFCLRYREECEVRRLPSAAGVSRARWGEVTRVNAEVNLAIAPQADDGDVVHETWQVSPAAGACHDYAVTKRHELMQLGWPSRALLLAEVVTSWGEHHLVLVIRTRAGDFVADSLNPSIRPWYATHYRWLRVQSPENPLYWSTVLADGETIAAPASRLAPDRAVDGTLVAADEVEVAAAARAETAVADARDAADPMWKLEAPVQRYVFDVALDQGGFSLDGPTALAAAPAVTAQATPAPPEASSSDAPALVVFGDFGRGLSPDPFAYGPLVSMN